MQDYLSWAAAAFLGLAAVVSLLRFVKSKNNGQLFITVAFALASAIFAYISISRLS